MSSRILCLFLFLLASTSAAIGQKFHQLSADDSGIDFVNTLTETDSINYFGFQYIYNGGGVAVGDINNDGLPDLYFSGNQVPNRLYLNQGDLKFKDITEVAGASGPSDGFVSGVTMADVNADGFLDIYICRSGPYGFPASRLTNHLLINNGDNTFSEKGEEYGIAGTSRTTHATFFDYDNDGDLDLYVLNHSSRWDAEVDLRDQFRKNPPDADTDRLYRNDGKGTFTDVTDQAGLRNWGFGLSVSLGDLNNDGWTDIYVANDYSEEDLLYINQRNGTFKEKLKGVMAHISNFSMGSDIADINNDGLQDVMVLDMMAKDNRRKKTNMSGMDIDAFWDNVSRGRHYQYMQNTLQLNNGDGTFSEIAELAGVANTDWSWTALLSDLDNDGWKDLFITNGYLREMRNNDIMKKVYQMSMAEILADREHILDKFPQEKLKNFAYQNSGDLQFRDVSYDWGLDFKGFTQGAVTVDLDRDGDLDVVVNNLEDPSVVFENRFSGNGNKFIRIKANGPQGNRFGVGMKVEVKTGDQTQLQQLFHSRGYISSTDPVLHFGVGKADQIDEVKVTWPDGKQQVIAKPSLNRELVVNYQEATPAGKEKALEPHLLLNVTGESKLKHVHRETNYDDFANEVLLPHRYSRFGPASAVADVNGDGYEDIFIGGAAGSPGVIFLQQQFGTFIPLDHRFMGEKHQASEDVGAAFFDADGDGDPDLYVASGSNEWPEGDPLYQDRLYLNLGEGRFSDATSKLPQDFSSSSVVAPADIDGDGDLDLFVGGRVIPGRYPYPAKSRVLENDNGGFKDVSDKWFTKGNDLGLVTDAHWEDLNGDKFPDLVVSGEWMPIRVFQNLQGTAFNEVTGMADLEDQVGWWYSLTPCDPDGDGDTDFIAGNLGLNAKYQASDAEPFQVHSSDLDGNGSNDIVLSYAQEGERFPVRGRQCSSEQVPNITQKFPNYETFANASLVDVYGSSLDKALSYSANNMSTSYLENLGGFRFRMHKLPTRAQFSPVMDAVETDIDGDGKGELVLVGNLLYAEVETCRHDASIGTVLKYDGEKGFSVMDNQKTGLFAPGDVRHLKVINRSDGKRYLAVVRSNGPLELFLVKQK